MIAELGSRSQTQSDLSALEVLGRICVIEDCVSYGKRHVRAPKKENMLEARGTVGTGVSASHDLGPGNGKLAGT